MSYEHRAQWWGYDSLTLTDGWQSHRTCIELQYCTFGCTHGLPLRHPLHVIRPEGMFLAFEITIPHGQRQTKCLIHARVSERHGLAMKWELDINLFILNLEGNKKLSHVPC